MDVTTTFEPRTRAEWRAWLEAHHASAKEIWLLLRLGEPGAVTYLDAVEEALCFGWIDGIAKRHEGRTAQRFTPRRARSHWTELNKARARRLVAAARMTPAGAACLPDLRLEPIRVAGDVEARLRAEPGAWETFQRFPDMYRRVRLGYVEEVRRRDPKEFEKRLSHLVARTARGEMFGNWDDSALPRTEP